MHAWGWESFKFDWLINTDMAIYTIVIAGVWQTSGFVMAMFLAGPARHRRRDHEGGADRRRIDASPSTGASSSRCCGRCSCRPSSCSMHLAIKSYDLVIALTGGGPGNATELPSTFMYSYTFTRNQMAVGAASAVIMLMTICRDHRALSLFRAEGEEAHAPLTRPPARARPPSMRVVIYGLLHAVRVVLSAAALRDGRRPRSRRSTRSATATCWRCRALRPSSRGSRPGARPASA